MSEKLLIARYKEGLIKYSEYQENIHGKEKLYCPFCDPPIRVTYNIKGFFMAWKNQGGHNCGKAREQARYVDPDWKGRKLTEIFRNQQGDLEITIDINTLVHYRRDVAGGKENNRDGSDNKRRLDILPTYKDREEVFRDVVRSVYQMKRILEKNGQEFLKSLKFRFKTSEGHISLNEAVIKVNELNRNIVGKSRFIIFKVNNSVLNNGVIYINAYSANGINLTTKLKYPYNKNPFKKFEEEYAIAYGEITYSEKFNKYFLTITNDFQIRKLEEDIGTEFFEDITFEEYDYKVFSSKKENTEVIKNNKNKELENCELGEKKETIDKSNINRNTIVKSQENYIQNNNLNNENTTKTNHNYANETKIRQTEIIEHKEIDKNSNLLVTDSDSSNMLSKIKKFLKNTFCK